MPKDAALEAQRDRCQNVQQAMARANNSICWFEIDDFLSYIQAHENPSGIQRVEREILTQLQIHYVPRNQAAACRLNKATHEFEPVDLSFLLDTTVDWRQRSKQNSGTRWTPNTTRRLMGTLGLVRRPRANRTGYDRVSFASGDVLVTMGGAWHDRHYPEALGRLRRERGVRIALMLHDIIPVTHPEWVLPSLAEGFRAWIREMVAIADLVFTSSNHVHRELAAYTAREGLRLPPVKLFRFASGFDKWNPAAPAKETAGVRLPDQFALCVSTIEFRKNHQLLAHVWSELIEKHGWGAVPHLVLVGRIGSGVETLMKQLVESRNLDGKIVIVSDVSDAELQDAYRSCRITVFPSLGEGWGSPITESLTYGKLCIASDRASIPEAGGDLVDYFDPEDPEDAVRKIERALFDTRYVSARESEIRTNFRKVSWTTYTDDLMLMLGSVSGQANGNMADARRKTDPDVNVTIRPAAHLEPRRKRILVLKLDHLGDFIIAVPALKKLRDEFRQDEITLICGSWNKALAEDLHIFDHVLTHDYRPRNARLQNASVIQPTDHFDSLLSGYYDIAVDLKADAETRVFLTRVNAGARCGFGSAAKFPYLDLALPLAVGRVSPAGRGRPEVIFGPEEFFSRVPASALCLETDFTLTDQCIIYGPYATLPQGDYIAKFYVTPSGLQPLSFGSSITFDVARNETQLGARRVTRLQGQSDLRNGVIAIPFSNHDVDGLFEFRVATQGRPYEGSLRFFGVTVESVSAPDQAASQRPSQRLHIGELMSMLVQLISDRFGRAAPPMRFDRAVAIDGARSGLEAFADLTGSILIAPFSNKATRDWPLSYFSKLVGLISSDFRNPIGLLGSAEHVDAMSEIVAENSGARLYNLAGKTKWSELPRLFENSQLVVSNNSGVAHFAAACAVPLVAIYSGAVRAEEWGPRGGNTIITLTADVPCSPCGYDKLEQCTNDHRCMKLISPERVFDEVSKLLKGDATLTRRE